MVANLLFQFQLVRLQYSHLAVFDSKNEGFNSNWFDYSYFGENRCDLSKFVSIPTGSITVAKNLNPPPRPEGFNSNWFDYSLCLYYTFLFCLNVSIPTGSITVWEGVLLCLPDSNVSIPTGSITVARESDVFF